MKPMVWLFAIAAAAQAAGADVTLVEAELTLADVVPAMAELRDALLINLPSS